MSDDYGDRISRENKMRIQINQKLVETGERERLKELLRTRLIECGWRDQLKAQCKGINDFVSEKEFAGVYAEIVRKKGLENVRVDDLVAEITPRGRALVPDQVKRELLQQIRTFLEQQQSNLS